MGHVQEWIKEGDRLLEAGELNQAGEAYARAIQQEPNKAFYHCKLGNALLRQSQTEAAERCFQQALSLNAESHLGLYGMAQVAAAQRRWQESIVRYKYLLTFKPGFAKGASTELEAVLKELQKERKRQQEIEAQRFEQWPYAPSAGSSTLDATGSLKLPETLPNGQPWPKISIVTPTYNQGDFIEETILSVVNQNYPNVEHIVIDGGSTDETLSILDRYKDCFSYVVSEPDDGQSSAINKGFEQATGEIFTWLNSDDRLSPGALYSIALAFYESKADIVAGACELLKDRKVIERHLAACPSGLLRLEEILDVEKYWLTGRFFYQPEVMFSRQIWEKAGGYVDTTLYYSMDYELWARLAHAGAKIEVIGSPIAQYRMHEAQKTSTTEAYRPELLKTSRRLQEKFGYQISPLQSDAEGDFRSSTQPLAAIVRPLRIVFFNDVGDRGGAGIAHHRIAQAFRLGGHVVESVAATLDWSLTPAGCSPQKVVEQIAKHEPDLVIVGNVHNTQQPVEILEAISAEFLTLYVMHDQWLMTGRCAYTGSCTRYEDVCDRACPTWEYYPTLAPEKIADFFTAKRALLEHPNFYVAADSDWLASWTSQVRTPALPVASIHYGLDTTIFRPGDQTSMRQRLDLPEDKFIIITGSQSLEDERKGAKVLLDAIKLIDRDDVCLVCFGHGATVEEGGVEVHFTGFVESLEVLAWYYVAADLFVGPSLEEAFGQTFIEAAACGTPAVGFKVGGVVQAVSHNISGKLADEVGVRSLAKSILELIEDPAELKRLKATAPIHVRNLFSLQRSYYTFVRCLENLGISKRLNVRLDAKFNGAIDMPSPVPIEKGESATLRQPFIKGSNIEGLLVSGFNHAELSRPDLNLPGGSRWLLWPNGKFCINAEKQQSGQLTVVFRNMPKAQVVTLQKGSDSILQVAVSTYSLKESSAISVPMVLQDGLNFFKILVSSFQQSARNSQRSGILIEKILFGRLPTSLHDVSD